MQVPSKLIEASVTEMDPLEKIALAVYLGVSAMLILRLWCVHRRDGFLKKIFWSIVLLVPLAGWVFYGGWYGPLPRNTVFTSGREYGDSGGPHV